MGVLILRAVFPITAVMLAAGDAPQQSSSLTGNPIIDALMGFGVIGIVLVLAAFGYIWFKPGVDQLKEDKKLLQAANAEYAAMFKDQVIPLLGEAARAMTTMAASLEKTNTHVEALEADVRGQTTALAEVKSAIEVKLAAAGGGG